ncbi:MAG: prepilin-type N-terminal cleavage/methylation domain-containing protein [Verrucomicrobiota bacterium]|nr:prepilin-type N-terminal cleavage/methylation domain-containing protein [Verrucomicrobiota bacterium]
MRQNRHGFTLIEIAIAVFILLLILMLGIPSMNGLMADRRLRRSLDDMNRLVRQAQERSMADRRPYLIVWKDNKVFLRPEGLAKGESEEPVAHLRLERGDAFVLDLPAALREDPPAEWAFWQSGTCEPARVRYKGPSGTWVANYSPLTARAEIVSYAAK